LENKIQEKIIMRLNETDVNKTFKEKLGSEFSKTGKLGNPEMMKDLNKVMGQIGEEETTEAMGAVSAGGYNMPLFSTTKKDLEDSVKKFEAKEATGSGGSGSYLTPKAWAKSTNKKDWRGRAKTQIPGGKFVQVKKKCKKFPYCNQGDINALHLTDNRHMEEAVKRVAQKFNLSEDTVIAIIKKAQI
jgi:hypothetical protein